jgi:hypothetical protein
MLSTRNFQGRIMPRTPGSLRLIGLVGVWGCMSQAGYLSQYEGDRVQAGMGQ